MYTYLVMFDCLVIDEPYFEYIKADSLDECWHEANKISRSNPVLSDGNFEIYRLMTEEDYEAEGGNDREDV